MGVTVVLAVAALRGSIPQSPDSRTFEAATQLGLLLTAAGGSALAWRWQGAGGSILVACGAGLGVLAGLQWHPLIALAVAAAFVAPGAVFLALWQRARPRRHLLVLLVVLVAVMATAGTGAAMVYGYYFGPAHPQSALEDVDSETTEWLWAGGTTSTSFIVSAKLERGVDTPRLLVSTSEDLADPTIVAAEAAPGDDRVTRFVATGLQPSTLYHYAVAAGGVTDVRHGRVRTFPAGPASFTIAVGSCARVGSNGQVYEAIAALDPLLYLVTGDIHYGDVNSADLAEYAQLYDRTLAAPAQAALYASTSIAYTWDDHDFGANDSGASSPSRRVAVQAYTAWVPHYPLALTSEEGPIAQVFDIGRVRVLLSDSRSQRTPETMLGAVQQEWLLEQLQAADADPSVALVIWVSSVPWIGEAHSAVDDWTAYPEERAALGSAVEQAGVPLLMVAGDAHMLAIDDGSHSVGGFPVFQAAALDRPGSVKGGPYSEGTIAGGGQFGVIEITDDGGPALGVRLEGHDWTGAELLTWSFEVAGAGPTVP